MSISDGNKLKAFCKRLTIDVLYIIEFKILLFHLNGLLLASVISVMKSFLCVVY